MDALYPGTMPMSKVNYDAKHDYEYVKNYKILQSSFDKQHIDKHIEVERLIKGKYQDNLEFLQWFHIYFEQAWSGGEYAAVERRALCQGGNRASESARNKPAPAAGAAKPARSRAAAARVPAEKKSTAAASGAAGKSNTSAAAAGAARGGAGSKESEQVAELKLTVDGLEKERDFYFGKLRDIEILCQNESETPSDLVLAIQKILYATEEDFVDPTELDAMQEA